MSRLTYIFVHGLSGWGSCDRAYRRMPYWGMRGGDLIDGQEATDRDAPDDIIPEEQER